jgi:putative DNA methylase
MVQDAVTTPIRSPRKLIEVALPLDDINVAAAREKSIRHGHPSTLHLWWARRPLAAARAVLFAQMVNDPGYETGSGFQRGVNKKEAALERERLFDIIRELVKWENTNNEHVLEKARAEIRKSWHETCELNKRHPQAAELFNPDKLPAFHDPFAGGGAIPLEAQRLGLEAHASDLNPVAVLINKAMIEIPPKFAGRAPVGPIPSGEQQSQMHEDWSGARGLAEDVRRYGHWMREEAEKRIGHLYPKVEITDEMAKDRPDLKPLVRQKLTVIAWLWARTVRSPNPACRNAEVPLTSTFVVSSKKGNEAWVEPEIRGTEYSFIVRAGADPLKVRTFGTRAGKAQDFVCLLSNTPIPRDYIRAEGKAGRLGQKLMAIVVEGPKGRVYLSPTKEAEDAARAVADDIDVERSRQTFLSGSTPTRAMITGGVCSAYGLITWGLLFSPRQLFALRIFSDLVETVRLRVESDADARLSNEDTKLYADAITTYLALVVDKCSDYWSSICTWINTIGAIRNTFARQAIPMVWDFAEVNPFSGSTGNWTAMLDWTTKATATLPTHPAGLACQADAKVQRISSGKIISSDPPYYDNIGYADLSDFFYPWLRRSLREIYPDLFATTAVPKGDELVATLYRHGTKANAERFFLDGMTEAMHSLAALAHEGFPVSIYYAFKQTETKASGTSSAGWETFLEAVLKAGFALTGTWPMRTEFGNRPVSDGKNALASSIILVCRRRPDGAPSISRKDFLRELKDELKDALEAMLGGEGNVSPIAPVDLAQAAIGPGMAVFSKYAAVLEADGKPMSVHTALTLINKQVDEALGGENFDADTNFCLGWFQEVGWSVGEFGNANTLAQAKGTSVEGAQEAGVLEAKGGKVRLFKAGDYPADWDPRTDNRTPVWEALHQLVRALNEGGESAAGALLACMPERGADIRRLAFWLYTLCERKGWAEDARGYNELVTAWYAIESASHYAGEVNVQATFDV